MAVTYSTGHRIFQIIKFQGPQKFTIWQPCSGIDVRTYFMTKPRNEPESFLDTFSCCDQGTAENSVSTNECPFRDVITKEEKTCLFAFSVVFRTLKAVF
jgi:hypothetical protein